MGNRKDQMSARLVYKNALDIVTQANLNPSQVNLTQSALRSEILLATNQTHYQFGISVTDPGQNNGNVFPTEVRLGQQNSFIVSEFFLYIFEPSSATDCTYNDYTWPNPTVFSVSGEAADLRTLYKGYLKITVNNSVKLPSMVLDRFWKVPFAQKQTAAANVPGVQEDSRDGATDGLSVTEPNIVFIGSKANLVEIFLPAGIAVLGTATRAALVPRGLMAINSTIIT